MSRPPNILEVSRANGFVITREYVNTLRRIMGKNEMSKTAYNAAVAKCCKLGRRKIVKMHREAFWKVLERGKA